MRITIQLDSARPPSGRVALEDGAEQAFDGWMQLLSILTRTVEAQSGADPHGSAEPEPAGT